MDTVTESSYKWFMIGAILLLVLLFLSFIITDIRKLRAKKVESFSDKKITASLSPLEITKDILPHLKCYVNASYPQRKALIASDNSTKQQGSGNKNKWEDLSGNKNDFSWNTEPKKHNKGYVTKGHTAIGAESDKFELKKSQELSVVIRSASLAKPQSGVPQNQNQSQKQEISSGQIITYAKFSNKGKPPPIVIPAEHRNQFTQLRGLLQKPQTEAVKTQIYNDAQQLSTFLSQYPANSNGKNKSPVSISFGAVPGNTFNIRLPQQYGKVEIDIGGKTVTSHFR